MDSLMAGAWVEKRTTRGGETRYRVEFRLGGRESASRYGGSFKTKREADARKAWVARELANMRVPDFGRAAVDTVTVRSKGSALATIACRRGMCSRA